MISNMALSIPSSRIRIVQQDLKCRQGCGYYGNAQFDGLCSKCFRERNDKRKRESQILPISRTDAVSQAKTHSNAVLSPHSSHHFVGQSPSKKEDGSGGHDLGTKKKSIVSALQKTLQSQKSRKGKDSHTTVIGSKSQRAHIPDANDGHFITQLRQLRIPDEGKRALKTEIQLLDFAIRSYLNSGAAKNIDELSEIVQNAYAKVSDLVQNDVRFESASVEDGDSAIDFFEKVIMTQNHKFLFCPYFTDDEENDVKIQRHIRQLSWITGKHLACSIDEVNPESRDLVYSAITELVGIDSYYSPQEKLECTVRCSRHIFELLKRTVGGPASADDFLPVFIFVVLKANPVRLHSNINFVTRFTMASRLMSGEGGYCFTNLCCAISFIENLKGESLGVDEQEFNALIANDKPQSTAWETALLACESLHQITENMKRIETLQSRSQDIYSGIGHLKTDITSFKREITAKVDAVLARAPLTVLPLKTPSHLVNQARSNMRKGSGSLNGYSTAPTEPNCLLQTIDCLAHKTKNLPEEMPETYEDGKVAVQSPIRVAALNGGNLTTTPAQTLSLKDTSTLLSLGPTPLDSDVLCASPILHYTPLDAISLLDEPSDSMDELVAPAADCCSGLINVNYDFDLSDDSGEHEHSLSDERHLNLSEFDPLMESTAAISNSTLDVKPKSLLESDSPPNSVLLPSPLLPIVADYRGFSTFQIPNISCNTGDFSSLSQADESLPHSSTTAIPRHETKTAQQ